MNISLPMELDTLHDEILSVKRLVDKWESYFKSTPLPVLDAPGTPEELEKIISAFRGEIRLVARKAEALAEAFDDF